MFRRSRGLDGRESLIKRWLSAVAPGQIEQRFPVNWLLLKKRLQAPRFFLEGDRGTGCQEYRPLMIEGDAGPSHFTQLRWPGWGGRESEPGWPSCESRLLLSPACWRRELRCGR